MKLNKTTFNSFAVEFINTFVGVYSNKTILSLSINRIDLTPFKNDYKKKVFARKIN